MAGEVFLQLELYRVHARSSGRPGGRPILFRIATVCTTARMPRCGFWRQVMKKILLAVAAIAIAPAAMAESEFSVVLQGGATHYTQSLSGSDTGAAYGVRLGMLPTPMLGIEVGYLGTQNNIQESLDTGRLSSTLHTNEGYGDVRINILPGGVTPYVFGGFGYTWVNGAEASGVPNSSTPT